MSSAMASASSARHPRSTSSGVGLLVRVRPVQVGLDAEAGEPEPAHAGELDEDAFAQRVEPEPGLELRVIGGP